MNNEIKQLIRNYGMQRILEDLITETDNFLEKKQDNYVSQDDYIKQLNTDLRKTLENYMNRYNLEQEEEQEDFETK